MDGSKGINIAWILPMYIVALVVAATVALWSLSMDKKRKQQRQQNLEKDQIIKITPKSLDLSACHSSVLTMINEKQNNNSSTTCNRDEGTMKKYHEPLKLQNSSHYQLFYEDVDEV